MVPLWSPCGPDRPFLLVARVGFVGCLEDLLVVRLWSPCGPLVVRVWSGRPPLAAGPKGSVDLRFALLHAMGTHSLYNLLGIQLQTYQKTLHHFFT